MLSDSQKNSQKLLTNKSLVTVRTDFLILEGKELKCTEWPRLSKAEQSMRKCICQQKDKATFCTKYILCKMLLMVRHHPPTIAMKSKDPQDNETVK